MPITIITTPGDPAANSFVTSDEADAYLATRLNAGAWTGVEPKKAALCEATRELSALEWDGRRSTVTQSLAWPRTLAVNPDAAFFSGSPWYDDAIIPQFLKDATCELALEFLRAGATDIAQADSTAGVIRKVVGPLETDWANPSDRASGLRRFQRVWLLISRYVVGGAGQARLVR